VRDCQHLDPHVGAACSSPGIHYISAALFSFRADFYLLTWLFAGGNSCSISTIPGCVSPEMHAVVPVSDKNSVEHKEKKKMSVQAFSLEGGLMCRSQNCLNQRTGFLTSMGM